MKLSIIIPVYRTENTLQRCVESIVGQTFTDLEVILVDDGSPDNCPQLCDEWAGRDDRVRVLHKKNGGLSSARNAGLAVARGTLITFVDSDDFVERNTYEHTVPLAEQADIVEFPVYWHYGTREQEWRSFGNALYTDMEEYWLDARAYAHTYACNKLYKRQLFNGVLFPERRVFEDVATLPRLLRKAKSVITTTNGCYYYCLNREGITAKATGSELEQLLEAHLAAMALWQDDTYYMHVLNTQIDVCEMTGKAPVMPQRYIHPFRVSDGYKQRIKALTLNLFGINGICSISKSIHRFKGHLS